MYVATHRKTIHGLRLSVDPKYDLSARVQSLDGQLTEDCGPGEKLDTVFGFILLGQWEALSTGYNKEGCVCTVVYLLPHQAPHNIGATGSSLNDAHQVLLGGHRC